MSTPEPSYAEQLATREVRESHARAFHRATYGRMQTAAGAHLPIWLGQGGGPTVWLDPSDEDGYARVAAEADGRSVYTPVVLRAVRAESPYGYGVERELTQTEMLFIDFDSQATGGKEQEVDGNRYPANHDELRPLISGFLAKHSLTAHAVTQTPSGFHVWMLTETLDDVEGARIRAGLEEALATFLHEHGFLSDKGVSTTPTRVGRMPGAYHSKRIKGSDASTPPQLILVTSTSDGPVNATQHLLATLPTVLPAKAAGLPVVDSDLLEAREQFARTVPVTDLMGALGWSPNPKRAGSWSSPVAGTSSDDAGHLVTSTSSGAEVLKIWSATTLEAYPGGAVFSSADLVALAAGDYRTAAQLWEKTLADATPATLNAILELTRTQADAAAWAKLARGATGNWPSALSRRAQERLDFRGVSAEVATGRGYSSPEELPVGKAGPTQTVDDILSIPYTSVTGASGVTAQARVTTPPPEITGPGRPRKDAGKTVVAREGFADDTADRAGLCFHPAAGDAVKDATAPLIVVTQDDPVRGERPIGVGQVPADAVLTAIARENLSAGVIHARDWAALMLAPGAHGNPTHAPKPHKSWQRIPLRHRVVYLVSRSTWREDRGLVQIIEMLTRAGAQVYVLDVPRPDPVTAAEVNYDTSTRGVGDWLAMNVGNDPLRRLIANATPGTEAIRQAHVPDAHATAELAETVVRELMRTKTAVYDVKAKDWARDMGTHMKIGGAGTKPNRLIRDVLWAHGVHVDSAETLRKVREACADDDRIQVETTDFDADPYVLPVLNGLVDLRSGELRERPAGHLNSLVVPVAYKADAVGSHWGKFLDSITLGRDDLATYLQTVAGLASIGEVIEEVLFFFAGSGRNGKSTFLNVVGYVLGEFAMTVPVEWLESKPNAFQRGDLRGKRLVLAPEPREGMRMSDSALKGLTSRDRQNGERKFGAAFSFTPSHTVISSVNHVPLITDRSVGSQRRQAVVPFDLNVSDADADRGLEARLRGEAEAVLAWIIAGAVRVAANLRASAAGVRLDSGLLDTPASVTAATKQNWAKNDKLAQWLEEDACTGDASATTNAKVVHTAFNEWMVAEGEKPWSPSAIRTQLDAKGITDHRTANGRLYRGILLGQRRRAATPAAPRTAAEWAAGSAPATVAVTAPPAPPAPPIPPAPPAPPLREAVQLVPMLAGGEEEL